MSRSNYSDDCEHIDLYRNAVDRSIKGKRGQAFLRKLKGALEGLQRKRLVTGVVVNDGEVCAIGALVQKEGGDVYRFEKYCDSGDVGEVLAKEFDVAESLTREIMYVNDEWYYGASETPEQRYERLLKWVNENIFSPGLKKEGGG